MVNLTNPQNETSDNRSYKTIRLSLSKDGVARVTLNRPKKRNAINPEMVAELTEVFTELDGRDDIKAIVLDGEGKNFCAGADIDAMQKVGSNPDYDANLKDARDLAGMIDALRKCRMPKIGVAHGPIVGGGMGLLVRCDFVIGVEIQERPGIKSKTYFSVPDLKLRILPATISPGFIERVGLDNTKKIFCAGRTFTLEEMKKCGVVDVIVSEQGRQEMEKQAVAWVLEGGKEKLMSQRTSVEELDMELPIQKPTSGALPDADIVSCNATLSLVDRVASFLHPPESNKPDWSAIIGYTAGELAAARASPQAQAAFKEFQAAHRRPSRDRH